MVATRNSSKRMVTCARQTPIDQWTIPTTWRNASNSVQSQRVGVVMHAVPVQHAWQSHAHDWFYKKYITSLSPNVSFLCFFYDGLIDWWKYAVFYLFYPLFFTTTNLKVYHTQKFIFPYSKVQPSILFSFFCIRKNPQKFIFFFKPQKVKIYTHSKKSCKFPFITIFFF